jgi:hypothetical protein
MQQMQRMKPGIFALLVMPSLVPGIHVLISITQEKTWMAGTSPAMAKTDSRSGGLAKGFADSECDGGMTPS